MIISQRFPLQTSPKSAIFRHCSNINRTKNTSFKQFHYVDLALHHNVKSFNIPQMFSITLCFLLAKASVGGVWIQGRRASVSSPWLTDSGAPLPYIGTYVDSPSTLALGMGIGSDAVFAPADVFSPLPFVCAI